MNLSSEGDFFMDTSSLVINTSGLFDLDAHFDIRIPNQDLNLLPKKDPSYRFQAEALSAILKGFAFNRHVVLQGLHGSGKTSHIEQVATRLKWPCVRINLDSHLTRMDLLGKDIIKMESGNPVTVFQEGLLTWAIQRPIALILDEYDAGRADTLFVLQRLLEDKGKLTLLEDNRVIEPHPFFRIFATMNTLGEGDRTGLYQGTQLLNKGQLDRWNLFVRLDYLSASEELELIRDKVRLAQYTLEDTFLSQAVKFSRLTREGFRHGEVVNLMSFRLLWSWIENYVIFDDLDQSLRLTYLNRCDDFEQSILLEYFQRCFG